MQTSNQTGNDILAYIDRHGVECKDAAPKPKNRRAKTGLEKKKKRVRKVIDLHGRRHDEVAPLMRAAFGECRRRGVDTLLIIHGKGYRSDPVEGPVVKKLVRVMLEHELSVHVRDFRTAPPGDGGEGATVVTLR